MERNFAGEREGDNHNSSSSSSSSNNNSKAAAAAAAEVMSAAAGGRTGWKKLGRYEDERAGEGAGSRHARGG